MMRTGIVSSLEVAADGKRLNGSFFLSEDEEAMRLLRRWKGRKDQIKDLSKPNGVFTGGIFRIVSVTDPVRGRPYVSAKDLCRSLRKPKVPAAKNKTFNPSASSMRSDRKVCSIRSARIPSNTYVGGSAHAAGCSQTGRVVTG